MHAVPVAVGLGAARRASNGVAAALEEFNVRFDDGLPRPAPVLRHGLPRREGSRRHLCATKAYLS